jgi:hypothetical protein
MLADSRKTDKVAVLDNSGKPAGAAGSKE